MIARLEDQTDQIKMSSQDGRTSSFPASMGPGARPIQNDGKNPQSTLQEVINIRSSYHVERQPNGISLSYQLKGMPRFYNISFDAMPLGGLSQTLLYGRPNGTRLSGTFVIDCIRGAENMTGQVMSQKEAESFALHCSKRMIYSYGSVVTALVGGYGMAYAGRKDMKFPFMKPKEPERYTNFPNRYLPILSGQYARIMWQITRANVYALIALLIVNPIGASIGNTSMMVGLYRDDRTKEYMKGIKGTLDRITSNQDRTRRGLPSGPPPQRQPQNQDDSASQDYGGVTPASMSESYNGEFLNADSSSDSGTMDNPSSGQRPPSETSSYTRQRPPQSQSPPPQAPPQQESDYFFDDASPTAGNDPDPTTPAPYTGSVWDRIRKGQQSSSSSTSRRPTPQASAGSRQTSPSQSSSAESFSFSGSDEEKALAKQQAQREFDEMLERERRESGNAEYERSMYAAGKGEEDPSGSGAGSGGGTVSAWARRRGSDRSL